MAKGKRKRDRKHKGGGGAGGGGGGGALNGAFWAQLIRETLGNFAGQLMADGTEQMAKGQNRADDQDEPKDVAADVLRALAESGPKSIADLITETGAGLTPMLRALQQTREFALIEVIGDEQVVQLTPCGSRTASALRREQINSDGMKMLES